MIHWRQIKNTWCIWPSRPIGLIEIIGGSYFSISPHITYKNLLESLYKRNYAIHAWSYFPGLDHQCLSNYAWKDLRYCKKVLEERLLQKLPITRIGHSLGCKLNLLSPDGGRNCKGI